MTPGKAATLLEILRAYAEAYVSGVHSLGLIQAAIVMADREKKDIRSDELLLARLRGHLSSLLRHCEHLPMTELRVAEMIKLLQSPEVYNQWTQMNHAILTSNAEIIGRLTDELSLNLFFKLPFDRKKYSTTRLTVGKKW